MRARFRISIALCLVMATGVLAVPRASAYIYWANGETGSIGRAANDGSKVEPNFITGLGGPISVAVDRSHIYWADATGHAIGRASISGGSVEPNFIPLGFEVNSVALDEGHVFWAEGTASLIGRAELDGSNVKPNFVPGVSAPCGLAFDAGHVYWAVATLTPGHIGRAGISNGTPLENEFVTVSPAGILCGVAVNSSSVFWADSGLGGGTNIGRASLSNPGSPDVSFIGAALGPCGLTLHESKLYWPNSGTSTIARANTDGTGVDYEYVHTGAEPKAICGIAVDDLTPPVPPPPGGSGEGEKRDTTPPIAKIKSGPGKKLAQGKAKFAFYANEPGSAFTCKLDKKKPAKCRSPRSYSGLKPGRHTFQVWATDATGNKSVKPAKRSFAVPAS